MLLHNSKYYFKSIKTNKVKSKYVYQFFTPSGTSSDKEQLCVPKTDVSKKTFCNIFCKRNFSSLSVFTPNPLQFLFLCLKKKKT